MSGKAKTYVAKHHFNVILVEILLNIKILLNAGDIEPKLNFMMVRIRRVLYK